MASLANSVGRDRSLEIGGMVANGGRTKRVRPQRNRLVGAYAALLLFMTIYCARPEDWIPGISQVPLAKVAIIVAIVALIFSLQQIRNPIPREFIFLAALVAQLFVASLFSPVWRTGALQETTDFAKILIVVVVITTTVTTERRLATLLLTQAISVFAIAAVAIWKGHHVLGRLEGLLGGNYTDPNDMALAIIISIPLCMALLFLTKSWTWKVLWSASILIMMYAVFLTGSRGGFLALTVTVGVCLWEFGVRGRRPFLMGAACLTGIVLWLAAGGMVRGRLKGTFDVRNDTAAAYSSGQERQKLFWKSIEITEEHPLFGVGPGNFDAVSGQWHTTHNSLTLVSSEGGIPALILYVLILWSGFKNINISKRSTRGRREMTILASALFASLWGYVVGSLFLSVAFQFFPYILVAYTTVLFSIARGLNAQAVDPNLLWAHP